MNEETTRNELERLVERTARSLPLREPPLSVWVRIKQEALIAAEREEKPRAGFLAGLSGWFAAAPVLLTRRIAYAAFAVACVAVLIGGYFTWQAVQLQGDLQTAAVEPIRTGDPDLDDAIYYYELSIGKLEKAAAKHARRYPPEVAALYGAKVVGLKESIARCKHALKTYGAQGPVIDNLLAGYAELQSTLLQLIEDRSRKTESIPS